MGDILIIGELEQFKSGALENLAVEKGDSPLAKSLAISDYFKGLSMCIGRVIPCLLVKFVYSLSPDEVRVKELQSIMSDVVMVNDTDSLLSFFKKYFMNLMSIASSCPSEMSQPYKALTQYISNDLSNDISEATHLDINDIVITLKKRVLTDLAEYAQILNNELTIENDYINLLKDKLSRHEWVCKLSLMQTSITECLRIGHKHTSTGINDSDKSGLAQLVEMEEIPDEFYKKVLELLEYYGVVKYYEKGQENHPIIVVMAANLSLCDMMNWIDTSKYREVQFLCSECFYIDTSLHYTRSKMKLNNVAIVASKIVVVKDESQGEDIVIDVSGEDVSSSEAFHRAKDGSSPGDHGDNGSNGKPGESGGNILICADELENSDRLILCSKGGSGGSGQDGGNGRNGEQTPSRSDNLSRFGNFDSLTLIDTWSYTAYGGFYSYDTHQVEGKSQYAYASQNGVQILYGRSGLDTYAFLYSRGISGYSANGGNAGRGGKAGCGGFAGQIDIMTKNCLDHNRCHDVIMKYCKGNNGDPGHPGKPGKKDLADNRWDYLIVDGLWKRALRYRGFIDARKKTGSKKCLPRGWYKCEPKLARRYDGSFDDGKIEFFKVDRDPICPTRYNRQAADGEEQEEQQEMVHATPSKPINRAEIQMAYQLFCSEHLEVQDCSSLIQLLEEVQRNMSEKLQELETTYTKQQHKQLRRLDDDTSDLNPDNLFDVDPKFLPTLFIKNVEEEGEEEMEVSIIFKSISKILSKLNCKPLYETDELLKYSIQQKFSILKSIVEDELAEQRKKLDEQRKKLEEQGQIAKNVLPEKHKCELIYQLMELVFNGTFLIHIDENMLVQFHHIRSILNCAEELTAPLKCDHFDSVMVVIKQCIKPMYEWCILSEAHQKLLHLCSGCTCNEFQRNAVTVYFMICSQNSIEDMDEEFSTLFNVQEQSSTFEIHPFQKPVPKFETSCSAIVPLNTGTKSALEMLMVFINEANRNNNKRFCFPNVLRGIEREYETYNRTISDSDLMFIMNYIQDKLDQLLLYRTQLEDTFCKQILSEVENLGLYEEGYLYYKDKTYQIVSVDVKDEEHVVVKVESDGYHTVRINLQDEIVTLNSQLMNFPKAIHISKFDINNLWGKIEELFIKNDEPEELDKFISEIEFPEVEFKHMLHKLLEQARSARDIEFDVFAFHPPSQWVEKLILSTVRRRYSKSDPNFLTELEGKISGISQCHDKSLYCTLYTQFLQETARESEPFKVDLKETFERMHLVFIEEKLCSLVTEQGLVQVGIEDADYIFCDLVDLGIIDNIGTYMPSTTEETIAMYCNSHEIDENFLTTVFVIQQSIGQLCSKELSFWCHKLGELRLRLSLHNLVGGNNEACNQMLVHIYQMQRHYGELEVLKFVELISSNIQGDVPFQELLKLLSKFSSKEWNFTIVYENIMQKYRETSDVSPLSLAVAQLGSFDWESHQNKVNDVKAIMKYFTKQLRHYKDEEHLVRVTESIVEIVGSIKERENCVSHLKFYELSDNQMSYLKINQYDRCHIAKWASKFRTSNLGSRKNSLIEAFAVIRRGITVFYEQYKDTKGIVPRDIQMVASLLFFQNLSAQGGTQGTKLLQQVSTGEGKTMILCMAAIYKVLIGEKVDIVTSSSVLATRDAVNQKPLYDMFSVTVSHCCHEDIPKRQKAYEADVVYGDVGSFQRDILETDFYDRKIRTDRSFQNVFVDEVDSMLVDKGQNMLYLPHAIPDMNCLDEVYLEIWSLVNAKGFLGLEDEQEQLYYALKHNLLGALAPNAFTAIPGVSEGESEEIFSQLVRKGVINGDDHCLTTKCFGTIKKCIETFKYDKGKFYEVLMIVQQHIETKPLIQQIPESLHSFIKKSLRSWIRSAVCAKFFRPNKEYIIDIDHRESACDRYPKIVIMDNETGVEQESSEWGSGLHQFLQLKHNLRLSTESLKAVYMSNISFFTRYQSTMGVTGTLGSVEEHTLFKKLYGEILILELPTYKPSKMIIELPLCCSRKVQWEEAVYLDVKEKLQSNRVVLLICEDVEGARNLQQVFKSKDRYMKQMIYFSSHQEKLEKMPKFESGQLIIATNIAGRGTDIKLGSEVKKNGGLHVCLSYLPPNVRVELQAYGRCARGGDPGSCRMIFYNKEGDLNYAIRKRNLSEAHRVAEIEADYLYNIKFQEQLFRSFTYLFNSIKEEKIKPEYRAVLDQCLDYWAFFLDCYTAPIESIPTKLSDERVKEKDRILRAFRSEVKVKLEALKVAEMDSLSLTPSRFLQLGHAFMRQELKSGDKFKKAPNKNNIELAVNFYRKAAGPYARYYLAAAKLNLSVKNRDIDRRSIKQEFYNVIPMFLSKIRRCQAQITKLQLANRSQDQSATENENYFERQKMHEIELYNQFISSMQDVTGKDLTESLFEHVDWGEKGAEIVMRIIQQEFQPRNPRVAKTYHCRLDNLIHSKDSYFTFEAKIRERVEQLQGKIVTREHFQGVLPDKREFWSLLKNKKLLTGETKTLVNSDEDGSGTPQMEELTAYWNPEIDIDNVQLEVWDCIDIDSFEWIVGTDKTQKVRIYSLLNGNVLNGKGQLISLDLAEPLKIHLPESFDQYYKAIKDTLWHHSIYRYILDHLRDSAEIDMENDVSDYKASRKDATNKSVVEILSPRTPSEGSKVKQLFASVIKQGKSTSKASAVATNSVEKFQDHIPSDALNEMFMQQLIENDLVATEVSGSGLNCLIYALFQHAEQNYVTVDFPEAEEVRTTVKQNHPDVDLTGMLHCDDEIAREVLACVNDMCKYKIGVVSAFIASSDGPLLYGGTSDKRYPSGKHVALWQQGNHFVAVVHCQEYLRSQYETENEVDLAKDVPVLNTNQLKKLAKLKIVAPKSKVKGRYIICKCMEEIESILNSERRSERLTSEDRKCMFAFLKHKLEVDFKTLCNSPRVLVTGQHSVLYDDLCQYAVVKEVKVKKSSEDIDKELKGVKIEDAYWYKDAYRYLAGELPFFMDETLLNKFLKPHKLTPPQYCQLIAFLTQRDIIDHMVSCTRDGKLNSAVNVISSATHLPLRNEVADFVLLMLQLRSNASFISSILKNQKSTLLDLDTPEASLRRLSDLFESDIQEKGDVLAWFSDNQCDFVINLDEQKWSWKTIITAISVIAIGVAQIALGAVLYVASSGSASFLCNALISEGVSDMIFGIEGLVRGHCNWSQYFDHKILSIAITVATAGIGAFLARGTQASRYTYKAFGSASKALAETTAKQTGKSLGKIMAKQVGKKIVKKVAGAVADASINLAIEAIVEEMSQSVDGLSHSIIDSFDTMSEDTQFREVFTAFYQSQEPDKVEKYVHQIFRSVMQQKTFLEIWDEIESQVQRGVNVATQAYGNASKKLSMVNKKLKGSKIMKGVGYASQLSPLITESIKTGLVGEKMDSLKKQLIQQLRRHTNTNLEKKPIDMEKCNELLRKELREMKQYLSDQVGQRGRVITSTCLQLAGQELKKWTITGVKNVTHKVKGHIDMQKLTKYKQKTLTAESQGNHSKVVKYEKKLRKLMSRTRNPDVFAHLIEYHNAQLGPAFAIPALEKMVGRPIKLVNEKGERLLGIQQQQFTGEEALVIKFIPGNDTEPGHYYVGSKSFSVYELGNNCLIHAVMKGAGIQHYDTNGVRKDIAKACKSPPCYEYIRSGIARNYVEIGLIGAGGRPAWWPAIYTFLQKYGTQIQNIHGLSDWNRVKKDGTVTLRGENLDICHIFSWNDIVRSIDTAEKSQGKTKRELMNKLVSLLPTVEEVKNGKSVFGESKGKEVFTKAFQKSETYEYGVKEVRAVQERFNESGKLSPADRSVLQYYLHSAPGNLRLGDASANRRIRAGLDHCTHEERSNNIEKMLRGHYTERKKDKSGKFMTSFNVPKERGAPKKTVIKPLIKKPKGKH